MSEYPPPRIDADPPLDPVIKEFAVASGAGDIPPGFTLQQYREALDKTSRETNPPLPEGISESTFTIDTNLNKKGKIPLVLFRPDSEGVLPVFLYFHGGAYFLGSPATHQAFCANIAKTSGVAVLFVDYSLSPEVKYPVAIEEGYQAWQWVQKHGTEHGLNGEKVSFAGDSCGTNMALAITLLSLKRSSRLPKSLFLISPWVDLANESWSYSLWPNNLGLMRSLLRVAICAYAPDYNTRLEPTVSPLLASDEDLKKLPETVIVVAESDVLRGEAEEFGRRLIGLGVRTYMSLTYGTIHDYAAYAPVQGTAENQGALDLVGGHARRVFA